MPVIPLWKPILLTGNIKLYLKKEIAQLISTDFHNVYPFSFSGPYQENVIKILEAINKPIVRRFIFCKCLFKSKYFDANLISNRLYGFK